MFEGCTLSFQEHIEKLQLFLDSFYFDNEELLELMLCMYQLALARIESGKMMFMVGNGGNGKGMHSILDQCMFGGENFGLLEATWFSDRAEFRKSAHLGLNKLEIRVQEASNSAPINSDCYKKFIVGEVLAIRQNYEKTK